MMRSAIVASCLIAMSVAANAQDSKLELYGDAEMSNCSITLSAPGVIQVHIFQTGDAAMATEFGLLAPACLAGATWLGDIITDPAFLTIGDTQRDLGIAVAFGGCVSTPIHIGYVNFLVTDIGGECCDFDVSDPLSPDIGINTVNCDEPNVIDPMATKSLTVNPNPGCLCNIPLAVESTTWGRVKSLYR